MGIQLDTCALWFEKVQASESNLQAVGSSRQRIRLKDVMSHVRVGMR